MLLQLPADVSALYEVYVFFIVATWSHEDTHEVQIVTQVLDERRPHTAERRVGLAVLLLVFHPAWVETWKSMPSIVNLC